MLNKCFFCGSQDVAQDDLRGRLRGIKAKTVAVVLMTAFASINLKVELIM